MPRSNPDNHAYRFTGQGKQLKYKTQPLSVRFPPDILETLKSREDTQDFVRAAVVEKLEREAGLSPEIPIATPDPPAKPPRPSFWIRLDKLRYSPIKLQSQRDTIANQPNMYGRILTKNLARLSKFEELKSLEEIQGLDNVEILD